MNDPRIIDPRNKQSNQLRGDVNLVYNASVRAVSGSATQRGLWNAIQKLLVKAEAMEIVENRKKLAK